MYPKSIDETREFTEKPKDFKLPKTLIDFRGDKRWVAYSGAPKDDGKIDKAPLNPRTGGRARNDNASTWATGDEARHLAKSLRQPGWTPGVGIQLGKLDGGRWALIGIDLDGCLSEGALVPWAKPVVKRLAGYWEVSPSGNGIKGFLLVALADFEDFRAAYRIDSNEKWPLKKDHCGIELHLTNSYFTVTGDQWSDTNELVIVGYDDLDWLIGHADALHAKKRRNGGDENNRDWTEKTGYPRETFVAAVVATPNDDSPYDVWCSQAFGIKHELGWKGEDVFLEWSRKSSKHDEAHAVYVYRKAKVDRPGKMITGRTVLAQAREHDWHDPILAAELIAELGPFELTPVEAAGWNTRGNPDLRRRLNRYHAVTTLGGKTVIMTIGRDSIYFGTEADLRLRYRNVAFQDQKKAEAAALAGGVAPPKMTAAEAWLIWEKRREYPGGVVFRPDGNAPADAYNLWRGWAVEANTTASCRLFLDHVREVICNGNEAHFQWVLGWMAHMVQRPGEKPRSAIVLRGEKGAGKDIVAVYLSRLMHRTAYLNTSDQDAVWGQFNGAIANKLLLHLEEAFFGGDHRADSRIKNLITAETQTINEKHAPVFTVASFHRLFITSNELRVVNSTAGERRYFISEVSDKRCGDKAYFDALIAEMNSEGPAALMHHLRCYDLSDWNPRPPATEALIDAIASNLTGVTAWMHDCIEAKQIIGLDAETEWPDDAIPTPELRGAFDSWAAKAANRYRGINVDERTFGKRIAPFLERPKRKVGPRGNRSWCYELLELVEAGEALNAILTKGNAR